MTTVIENLGLEWGVAFAALTTILALAIGGWRLWALRRSPLRVALEGALIRPRRRSPVPGLSWGFLGGVVLSAASLGVGFCSGLAIAIGGEGAIGEVENLAIAWLPPQSRALL